MCGRIFFKIFVDLEGWIENVGSDSPNRGEQSVDDLEYVPDTVSPGAQAVPCLHNCDSSVEGG